MKRSNKKSTQGVAALYCRLSLFERIYEDSCSGKISEERFAKMSRKSVRFPIILLSKQKMPPAETFSVLERVMGIEPTQPAWKAGALPLSHTRMKNCSESLVGEKTPPAIRKDSLAQPLQDGKIFYRYSRSADPSICFQNHSNMPPPRLLIFPIITFHALPARRISWRCA